MSHADAEFLKRCARVLDERIAFDDANRLRTDCWHAAIRIASDIVRAYRACPAARCRRQRRCAGPTFRCQGGARERGPDCDIRGLVNGLYKQILQRHVDEAPRNGGMN
ncbi:hypothetical protein RPMA_21595 [Tardiphaga alba]|uniref:Uncharacterized protein n=1 Tax=Tardiphaga alba TaxID=340268 RepID=A0ABX8ABJ5_9BRAD|nr:hypothetical protein [Tardiphaga alba]QUS41146.1 hypothetical protein RPMA_21595 [Tardiphaga alba]